MLATEIARDDGVMACEMRLAVLAAEDLVRVEVGVVDEAHARRRERERVRRCVFDRAGRGLPQGMCFRSAWGVDAGVARWCGDRPRPREVRAGFWMAEIYVSALSLPSVRDSVLEPFFFFLLALLYRV